MSKDPMRVLPDDLFPPEVTTPEERFELLGRRLFAADPDEVKRRQAEHEQQQAEKPKRQGAKRRPSQ